MVFLWHISIFADQPVSFPRESVGRLNPARKFWASVYSCTYSFYIIDRVANWYWDYHHSVMRIEWTYFHEAVRQPLNDLLNHGAISSKGWKVIPKGLVRISTVAIKMCVQYRLAGKFKLVELLDRGLRLDQQKQFHYFRPSMTHKLGMLVQQSVSWQSGQSYGYSPESGEHEHAVHTRKPGVSKI